MYLEKQSHTSRAIEILQGTNHKEKSQGSAELTRKTLRKGGENKE